MRTIVDKGEWVKNYQFFADVLYGRLLALKRNDEEIKKKTGNAKRIHSK